MTKRWSRTKLLTLAMMLVLAMLVVACGGGGDQTSGPSTPPSSDTPSSEEPQQQDEPLQPLTIRFVGDFPPPPHPAASAMEYFAQRLPEVIPGSDVRIYYAGALYSIPEAFEAMSEGALEMTWGQFGKAGPVEPLSMLVVGPGLLTTIGAIDDALENSEAVQRLYEIYEQQHGVTILGTSHMSHGMGVGAAKRVLTLDDWKGMTIRSQGPAENAALEAWGAVPVTMAFGEVPSAMDSGVIDGMLTSLGGWGSVVDIAPYFTIAGVGGITGDYYFIGASTDWLNSLNEPTRNALIELFQEDIIPFHKALNYCLDMASIEKYGTDDPTQPGIYQMTPEETAPWFEALGDAVDQWKRTQIPAEYHDLLDQFNAEAPEYVAANPPGSYWIEQTDCSEYEEWIQL